MGGCCVISSLTGHLLQIIVLQRNIGHIQKHQRSLAKALVSIAKPLLTENVVLVVLMVVGGGAAAALKKWQNHKNSLKNIHVHGVDGSASK